MLSLFEIRRHSIEVTKNTFYGHEMNMQLTVKELIPSSKYTTTHLLFLVPGGLSGRRVLVNGHFDGLQDVFVQPRTDVDCVFFQIHCSLVCIS